MQQSEMLRQLKAGVTRRGKKIEMGEYHTNAANARDRSNQASESSARHERDLKVMRSFAVKASNRLKRSQDRQRARWASVKKAA